jgi:hypothetical protein
MSTSRTIYCSYKKAVTVDNTHSYFIRNYANLSVYTIIDFSFIYDFLFSRVQDVNFSELGLLGTKLKHAIVIWSKMAFGETPKAALLIIKFLK